VRDARLLYLLSRHFPERARALEPRTLQTLVAPLTRGQYNTHSAAALLMAFDAYASTVPANALGKFTAGESAAGKNTPLELKGQLILRGAYAGDSTQLHVDNATGMSGFYAVTNAGFDRSPPSTELRQGIEILREYLDAKGQPVATVDSGAEVTVRLRLRAIDREFIPNVAVIDLLPGGFEPVLQHTAASAGGDSAEGSDQSDAAANSDATADEQSAANGDAAANDRAPGTWFDRLGGGGWRPEFADIRDDRVVLYGTLTKDMAQYTYKIRATNAGTFVVPPSYVESMYDRSLRARSGQSHITVVQPAGH
jgi:alpha-2-macroglobulin